MSDELNTFFYSADEPGDPYLELLDEGGHVEVDVQGAPQQVTLPAEHVERLRAWLEAWCAARGPAQRQIGVGDEPLPEPEEGRVAGEGELRES